MLGSGTFVLAAGITLIIKSGKSKSSQPTTAIQIQPWNPLINEKPYGLEKKF